MNVALALIVIAEVCLGICAWRSAEYLRWMAAHLLTRADVIDLSKAATKRRLEYWSLELGVENPGFRGESSRGADLENVLVRPRAAS